MPVAVVCGCFMRSCFPVQALVVQTSSKLQGSHSPLHHGQGQIATKPGSGPHCATKKVRQNGPKGLTTLANKQQEQSKPKMMEHYIQHNERCKQKGSLRIHKQGQDRAIGFFFCAHRVEALRCLGVFFFGVSSCIYGMKFRSSEESAIMDKGAGLMDRGD